MTLIPGNPKFKTVMLVESYRRACQRPEICCSDEKDEIWPNISSFRTKSREVTGHQGLEALCDRAQHCRR